MSRFGPTTTLDAARLTRLYRTHSRELLMYLTARTYDVEVAFDLLAETFAAAFRDRRQFAGGADAEALAWIYAIARHQLSHYFRRGHAETRALHRLGLQPAGIEDEDLRRIEELAGITALRARVAEELERLGPARRDAVLLRVVEELPYAAIADELGVSEQTARARVSRGLRQLSQALEDVDAPPA